nr:hypothetical protein [Ruegeria lacuscaerulensis]
MKPAFELIFSSTGISLHHLANNDSFWLGDVFVDEPDLGAQLATLRDKAFALETQLSCTLVLPKDQVRYLAVDADGADGSVETALTSATPYTLDELVYDTATRDQIIHVAAVAKQTLTEAREFATEHGFVPVQITAPTDGEDYPEAPQFLSPEPIAAPVPDTPQPAVHVVAPSPAAADFRSVPEAETRSFPYAANLTQYTVPAAVAGVAAVAILVWALGGNPDDEVQETETAQIEVDPEIAVAPPEPLESVEADPDVTDFAEPEPDEPRATETVVSDPVEIETAASEPIPAPAEPEEPALSATDVAILEALKVAPTVVEPIAPEPEPQPLLPAVRFEIPQPLNNPVAVEAEDIYLASIDPSDLSRDAVALPQVARFDTDLEFDPVAQPSAAGTRFELDERGLVTPTAEGTLNPDGIVVYLGRPSKVPPDVPVRFEEEPVPDEATSRLAELPPKPRPENLIDQFERQQLGGRTLQELAVLRPKLRPASLKPPEIDYTPTALAVVRVPRPKPRPAGAARSARVNTVNLGSTAAVAQSVDEAESFQPKAVAPKIPSSASVARQATIDNAINLRKLNLIGVYGTPANRRALVRLPSGRYKKLKVGDRLDGGNVVAIGDSELRYQKRGQNVTLRLPRS